MIEMSINHFLESMKMVQLNIKFFMRVWKFDQYGYFYFLIRRKQGIKIWRILWWFCFGGGRSFKFSINEGDDDGLVPKGSMGSILGDFEGDGVGVASSKEFFIMN